MATLTITTTAQQDARIVKAFGAHFNLKRDATGPEVRAYIIDYIKSIVRTQELREAQRAAAGTVQEIPIS